jgi:hypothetical protein
VIRRAVVTPLASMLRAVGRALPEGPVWNLLTEPTIYLLGWLAWVLDWIPRLPKIAAALAGRLGPATIDVRPIVLLELDRDPVPLVERARRLCADASTLLEPHGLTLSWESPSTAHWPGRLPRCSARGLLSAFFRWASAHADAHALTVYLVDDLGKLAGCSFPGADWVILDARTDGTTLVHELGHLADLWRHSGDPNNVMTNQAGGSHARLTRFQAAMIRSSRFARGVRVVSARVPGRREPD